MRFVLASLSDFERAGIPITTERQHNGFAVKHEELLTEEQLSKLNYQIIEQIPQEWDE